MHTRFALCLLALAVIACGSADTIATQERITVPPADTEMPALVGPTDSPTEPPPPTFRPTNTYVPTYTPTADTSLSITQTAVSTLTIYAEQRDDIVWILRDIKADIDPTFGLYIEGKVAASDPVWQAEVGALFEQFDAGVEWYFDLQPPRAFEEEHLKTASGVLSCSTGFWSLYNGAKAQDAELYQTGVDLIGICNSDWDEGDRLFAQQVQNLGLVIPEP